MTKKICFLSPMTDALPIAHMEACFKGISDVDVIGIKQGPAVILSRADQTLAGPGCIEAARAAESEGYGAIVIGCLSDPNLDALRESVKVPVIGAMQVAMHFCAMLAGRFSIICCDEPYIRRSKEDLIARYGFTSRVASIRSVPSSTREIASLSIEKPVSQKIMVPTLEQCLEAIRCDGATALIFGCGVFTLVVDEIKQELKNKRFELPVINPFYLAVDFARFLTTQELSHSQQAYPLAFSG